MSTIIKLVEVVNNNNFPVYLQQSKDPKDTMVIPPKGRSSFRMTEEQIEYLKKTKLQFNIKG